MQYLVVLLIFAVFLQTRMMDLRRSVYCLAMQSGIIACACVVSGASEQGLAHVILPGVLTLGVKVMFIPWAMLRLIDKLTDENELRFDTNVNYSTMPGAFGRDVIAASILMIMTGLSLMVMRKRAIMQMCGLITLENGIYLLGLLITEGLPLVVELGVFLDVLIAVVVLVILTSRMSLSFMTTDTTVMHKLKG